MFGGIARTRTRINKNQQRSTEIDKNNKSQQKSTRIKHQTKKMDHIPLHLLAVRLALEPSPFPQIHPIELQLQYLTSQVSHFVRLEDMEILAPRREDSFHQLNHHCQ